MVSTGYFGRATFCFVLLQDSERDISITSDQVSYYEVTCNNRQLQTHISFTFEATLFPFQISYS